MKTIEIRTSTTPIQPAHQNKSHGVACPAAAAGGVLECLLGKTPEQCGFASLAVEPRSALPAAWLARYSFAVVRRGYLIRQRTDAAGRATSIDAVGPGCCFPLDPSAGGSDDSSTSGYALTPALVCLSDDETIQRGLADGGPGALADTLRPVDDSPARVSPEFQQRDLAGLLSIRHESVCRALRAFVQQGLVSRDNTGIVLHDRTRLAML